MQGHPRKRYERQDGRATCRWNCRGRSDAASLRQSRRSTIAADHSGERAHGAARTMKSRRAALLDLRQDKAPDRERFRSEEHTSELQSLMRISYAVFCLKKKQSTIHKKL